MVSNLLAYFQIFNLATKLVAFFNIIFNVFKFVTSLVTNLANGSLAFCNSLIIKQVPLLHVFYIGMGEARFVGKGLAHIEGKLLHHTCAPAFFSTKCHQITAHAPIKLKHGSVHTNRRLDLALAKSLLDVGLPLHIAFIGGHHVTGYKFRFVAYVSI